MDELTPRRQQKLDEETPWFIQEWDYLTDAERAYIRDVLTELHDAGLRHRPAAVAWLDEHRPSS